MSTHAIIGIQKGNGSILGAWQWCDGDALLSVLNEQFCTEEAAMALISEGMWSSLFTIQAAEDFESWINEFCEEEGIPVPVHSYTDVLGFKLLKYPHHENQPPKIYTDFDDANGQDINCLYLFDREFCKWKVYW